MLWKYIRKSAEFLIYKVLLNRVKEALKDSKQAVLLTNLFIFSEVVVKFFYKV